MDPINDSGRGFRRLLRTAATIAIVAIWYFATASYSPANSISEDYAFAGALAAIPQWIEHGFDLCSFSIFIIVFGPAAFWVWSGKWWAAAFAFIAGIASIGLTVICTSAAGC